MATPKKKPMNKELTDEQGKVGAGDISKTCLNPTDHTSKNY
jgi:hypothetical protein